ncbi:MAG: BCCT family transporter [Rhizobiales bacterium]|nr:BCCT family transporter [Hyphomicrobiales bacterium]
MKSFTISTVFVLSILLCGGIGLWGVVDPASMTGAAQALTGFAFTSLDWFFLLLCTGFLALSIVLAVGPYGGIKLGHDDEEPEFSTASWIAMLFAGGMGAGLLFWGVAEPMHHYYSPPGMTGGTPEAARTAMVITNLHWGLHAWAIYAVCALVIAYFVFRKDAPSLISTPIRMTFSGRGINIWANTADVLAVLAVIFGLAGSLSMGTLQVRAGLGEVFGVEQTTAVSLYIVLVLAVTFMLSASTGLDKGIKILSNINMFLAVTMLLYIIFLGPTRFILETFTTTIGDYFSNLIAISFRLFPYQGLTEWTARWTLTYLIWWLAFGPFVGIFIARISRGRTIREFMIGVVLVPTLFSMLWFAALGGTGFYIEMFGPGGLSELVFEDVTKALFSFFNYFPLSQVLSVAAVLLIFIFLVTSADSGTFVVSMMTTNGSLNPPVPHRLVWAVIITALTVATLLTESIAAAKAMAVTGAIPFSLILIAQIIAFLRTLREDVAQIRAREAEAGHASAPVGE